jgi:hypothetical protein
VHLPGLLQPRKFLRRDHRCGFTTQAFKTPIHLFAAKIGVVVVLIVCRQVFVRLVSHNTLVACFECVQTGRADALSVIVYTISD